MPKTRLSDVSLYGFDFGAARDWYDAGRVRQQARDAALVTTPSTTVPAEFTTYIDPMVVEILTSPLRARLLGRERRAGNFATTQFTFRVGELVGASEPYSDFADNRTSDVNYNWPVRENYLFQTVIRYGDRETALTGAAKISLAADKQRAAANTLDHDANSFALLGVAGLDIYGILNAPELPAAITPGATGTGGGVTWNTKDMLQIYNDILLLFAQLAENGRGWIDQNTPLQLIVSPRAMTYLGRASEYNTNVLDLLQKYFSRLEVVVLPELQGTTGGETILLKAASIQGQPVIELPFSEKVRAGRVVEELSSIKQKWEAGTYGALLIYPFAIAQMRGVLD